MSTPQKQIHLKARKGSALESFAVAYCKEDMTGISERMHTLVERFDAMLDAVPVGHRIEEAQITALADALNDWPLPPANRADFRNVVMARVASHGAPIDWDATKVLVDRLQTMSLAALVWAVEMAERTR